MFIHSAREAVGGLEVVVEEEADAIVLSRLEGEDTPLPKHTPSRESMVAVERWRRG